MCGQADPSLQRVVKHHVRAAQKSQGQVAGRTMLERGSKLGQQPMKTHYTNRERTARAEPPFVAASDRPSSQRPLITVCRATIGRVVYAICTVAVWHRSRRPRRKFFRI